LHRSLLEIDVRGYGLVILETGCLAAATKGFFGEAEIKHARRGAGKERCVLNGSYGGNDDDIVFCEVDGVGEGEATPSRAYDYDSGFGS